MYREGNIWLGQIEWTGSAGTVGRGNRGLLGYTYLLTAPERIFPLDLTESVTTLIELATVPPYRSETTCGSGRTA